MIRKGRIAIGFLFVLSAAANAILLIVGQSYAGMADGAYVGYVREMWEDVLVPNTEWFISLLIAFEAAVGALVLLGGRRAVLGLVGAIAFHLGLMLLGWGFWIWSVPLLAVLGWLLAGTRRELRAPTTGIRRHLRAAA